MPGRQTPGPRTSAGPWGLLVLLVLPFTLGMASLAFLSVVLGLEKPGLVWAWITIIAVVLGVVWFASRTGVRVVPWWLGLLGFAVLIGGGYALGFSEWTAPIVAAAAIGLMVWVRRFPRVPEPPPATEFSRAGGGQAAAATVPAEAEDPITVSEAASASPAMLERPVPPRALPQSGPPVRIRLLSNWASIAFTLFGVALLVFGVWIGWLLWHQPEPLPLAIKLLMSGFAGFLALIGLGSAVAGAEAWGDTLVIDGRGISRVGVALGWEISWDEVAAVGLMDNSRVIPHMLDVTPRRLRERRDVRLVLALTDDSVGKRAHFLPWPGLPAPFTHQQRLADLSAFRRGEGLVPRLDEALAHRVPERYLGYRMENPGQQLPARDT